jgi:hypothetical protein
MRMPIPDAMPCSCFSIHFYRANLRSIPDPIIPRDPGTRHIIISPARPVSSVPEIPIPILLQVCVQGVRIPNPGDVRFPRGSAREEVGWCIRVELIIPAWCRREEGITDTRGYDG